MCALIEQPKDVYIRGGGGYFAVLAFSPFQARPVLEVEIRYKVGTPQRMR